MILYFTGTGNSRYIAEKLAAHTGDELLCINDRIKTGDKSAVSCRERLVFVTPTYAWRIPCIVRDWISAVEFSGTDRVWFVMDCGSEIGDAAKYNRALCAAKGFIYMGTAQIVMPENYIAMFDAPDDAEAKRITEKAGPLIDRAAGLITEGLPFPAPRRNLYDRLMSGPVNAAFYPLFVNDRAFTVGDGCIGCGKCERLCPLNDIRLVSGRPVWQGNCTHCMACICYCPAEAIEYGRKSRGKPRYHCKL